MIELHEALDKLAALDPKQARVVELRYFGGLTIDELAGLVGSNLSIAAASAATVAQLDASDPMTWLAKSICVDALNQPLNVDPYGGCPAGASIRKVQVGDPLPYHNIEQFGYQQRDAFPVSDPVKGKTWIINTYDYPPFNFFNLYATSDAQSDGYDVVTVQDGWASIANTSDGGGYEQSFYGSN